MALAMLPCTYHPMKRFRVNMAAIGIVLDIVLDISEALAFATGSWYGMTEHR